MSAKEMFEKLGYELISYGDKELVNYRINSDENSFMQVVFNNKYKSFWCGKTRNTYFNGYLQKDNTFMSVNLELLQAINKQIEELWGEEVLKNDGNK